MAGSANLSSPSASSSSATLATSPSGPSANTRRSLRKAGNDTSVQEDEVPAASSTSSDPAPYITPGAPLSASKTFQASAPQVASESSLPSSTQDVQPAVAPASPDKMPNLSHLALPSPAAPPSRSVSPASASAQSPLPPSTSPTRADYLTRAQAMGMRWTREEFERTKAGVTAFLKADRVPGTSSARKTSPHLGTTSSDRVTSPVPSSLIPSSAHESTTATGPAQRSPKESQSSEAHIQRTASSSRLPLSFFTAVVPIAPKEIKPRPKLDDVGSAEEKRKRRERRRRQREKMIASTSLSEPETSRTPRVQGSSALSSASVFGGSPMSVSSSSGARLLEFSGSRRGLGSTTPETSPLDSISFPRARTLSASVFPTSSNDLQAAVSDYVASPGFRKLNSRAWMSANGILSLMDRSPPGRLLQNQSTDSTVPLESDDEGEYNEFTEANGHDSASRAGWGVGTPSVPFERNMAKLSLLDRVMNDKGCPKRRRRTSSSRRSSHAHQDGLGEILPVEPVAFTFGASETDNIMGPPSNPGASSQLGPAFASNTHHSTPNVLTAGSDTLRRRSHSRQFSQVGKTVRWAPSLAPVASSTFTPGHQRMTTRDHYEFFVHGISPDASIDLSEMVVEQPPHLTVADATHTAMPWLYSSALIIDDGSAGSPAFRVDGSPMGRSPQRLSFATDDFQHVTTSPNYEYELGSHDRRASSSARRGLLFGPSAASPTRPTVNRFNPGFSDPALSQSPQRGTILSSRHTRGKSSLGSIRDLFAGGPLAVVRTPEGGVHQSNSTMTSSRSRSSVVQHPNHPTVSPAAIFGGAVVPVQGQSTVDARSSSKGSVQSRTAAVVIPDSVQQWEGDAGQSMAKEEEAQDRSALSSLSSGESRPAGLARVRSEGTMDWGISGSQEAFERNSNVVAPPPATKAPSQSISAPTKAKGTSAATSASVLPTAHPRNTPKHFGPLPPDASLLSFERSDGSLVVKLVSEELQAALDAGDFEEPPPRYYVLPPGAGSTKAKPPHVSYAGLIGQAILTSSDLRLSLAEIYNWISTVHPFFERGDRGWQNSIRHNLSLNKSFIKVEREANIPGKGGWWAIKEGHEERFKDGLYSAGPNAVLEKSSLGGGSNSSKKSKKKAVDGQEAVDDEVPTPASSQRLPLTQSQGSLPDGKKQRKRQATDGSYSTTASSPGSPSQSNAARGSKAGKKVKLAADIPSRQPLTDVTNRHFSGAGAPTSNLVHYGEFFTATPARRGSHNHQYMASSGGMPTLTDGASSPPSSPAMFEADVTMPPPPSTKRKGGKRGMQQSRVSSFSGPDQRAYQDYAASMFSAPQQHLHLQTQQQQHYPNAPFNVSGLGASSFYPPQPSPLAGRWRGSSGTVMGLPASNGSPLRRTTTSPAKLTTHSPVSSVRDSTSSALAGAMNIGSGVSQRHRRTGSALSGSVLMANGQSFAAPQNPFQQGSGANRNAKGGTRSENLDDASSRNVANPSLSMALYNDGHRSPGSGTGGFQSTTHLTPGRLGQSNISTPKDKMVGHGVSPSPTTRRFQASQHHGAWLEDPFDYQGALQHEFENMNGGGAAGHAEGASGQPTPTHYTSMSGGGGSGGMGSGASMMGLLMGGNGSPVRLGHHPVNGWLSTGTQQDNISAVRGSPDGRD